MDDEKSNSPWTTEIYENRIYLVPPGFTALEVAICARRLEDDFAIPAHLSRQMASAVLLSLYRMRQEDRSALPSISQMRNKYENAGLRSV